jgi:hypothetical protein
MVTVPEGRQSPSRPDRGGQGGETGNAFAVVVQAMPGAMADIQRAREEITRASEESKRNSS